MPNVAYCYEDDFNTVDGLEVPEAPARIETIKGDNIAQYMESDLKYSFRKWTNVKGSDIEEVNGRGRDFDVEIHGKTVLIAPYISPRMLQINGDLVVSSKDSNLLFDGVAASTLRYTFSGKD